MEPNTRHQYHPFVPLAFHLGILPGDLLSQIPRSTRHDWKNKDIEQLFGYDHCVKQDQLLTVLYTIAENKRLLVFNKVLIRLIAVIHFIGKNVDRLKQRHNSVSKVVIENLQKVIPVLGLITVLKWSRLSYANFHKWQTNKQCNFSPILLCRRKHPAQLLAKESDAIKKICEDPTYAAWPLSSVFHFSWRNKIVNCSLPTFYRYASLLSDRNKLPAHRRKNHCTGIRASQPLQIIHTDITQFTTLDNRKAYIYFVQDNFSRAILSYKIENERKASHTLDLIKETYECYIYKKRSGETCVITDDGCENKKIMPDFAFRTSSPVLKHMVAQKDIILSNSMIEYLNRTIKYRYLYQKEIPNFATLESVLEKAVINYNNRPVNILKGLTPLEALEGQSFDSFAFNEQIRQAVIARIAQNKSDNCCYAY